MLRSDPVTDIGHIVGGYIIYCILLKCLLIRLLGYNLLLLVLIDFWASLASGLVGF